MAVINAITYQGELNVPQDVKRRRRQVQQLMTRMGTPCLVKHMFNIEDVENGIAVQSPYMDDIYNQTRYNDPISHGMGFVSVELSNNEWISPQGAIVIANSSPGAGYTKAPRYRGFGQGYLTYVILPDVAQDMFKLDEAGAFIRIQTARAQMGWYPDMNDNDLLVLVEIDRANNIVDTKERYQLKQTNPVSMRGRNHRGRRDENVDFGNQHLVNQTFELTLVPPNNELYNVETDR